MISTRRLARRFSSLVLGRSGRNEAWPLTLNWPGGRPVASIRKRPTRLARASDSSQFEGKRADCIGRSSVWPMMLIMAGVCASTGTSLASASRAAGVSSAWPEGKSRSPVRLMRMVLSGTSSTEANRSSFSAATVTRERS